MPVTPLKTLFKGKNIYVDDPTIADQLDLQFKEMVEDVKELRDLKASGFLSLPPNKSSFDIKKAMQSFATSRTVQLGLRGLGVILVAKLAVDKATADIVTSDLGLGIAALGSFLGDQMIHTANSQESCDDTAFTQTPTQNK